MFLSIRNRLFLAFLLATCSVVASMYFIMKASFDRSLLRYVDTVEGERLERLADSLEGAYREHGSWDFLRDDPVTWLQLVAASRPDRRIPPHHREQLERWLAERPPREFRPPPGLPRRMRQMFEWRVVLLDEKRQVLFGVPEVPSLKYRPLTLNHRTIGYLGVMPPRIIIDVHQQRFAEEQRRSSALIALLVAAAAALLSLPLARRLVQRITVLATATHGLAAGAYDIRVPVTSSDELGQLARDFNALADTLARNEQLRRRWVADISHELRTPVAVLRGELEAVQDGVREVTPQTIETLHGEVMRLGRLINDLYELSLADIGGLHYRKRQVDLTRILAQAVESFQSEFNGRQLQLDCDLPAQPITVQADAERLHQLFANLLENSLRYTDPGGTLRIILTRSEGWAVVDFQDSAPGVAEADLARLFERLYRVESSRSRAYGGAGLGLALCQSIVEAHQGSIVARHSPLGGLWLTVNLPSAKATAADCGPGAEERG